MKLRDVIKGVEPIEVGGSLDVEVTAVTADSRQAAAGALFVAVPGFNVSGDHYVDEAVGRGAVALVTQQELSRAGVPVIRVRDSREALAVVAANIHGRPAERLSIIGVTGTSGKTTTTKMIESILDAGSDPVGLIGTIEYRSGDDREIADRTTPDAVVLHEWFAKMVAKGVRHCVMEVSSHALALKRTFGIPFAAAVFTNLSRDHFDFHRDFDDYFAAKRILFDQIDRSKRTAVVNIDDEFGRRLAEELGAAVLTFGSGAAADIRPGDDFSVSVEGLRGVLLTPTGEIAVDSPLIGLPNLYNWMGAVGAAIAAGVPAASIPAGIRNLRSVTGRFERVGESDVTAIVDYAHKPDALEKLLQAARQLAPGRRLLVVFGCGGDRDQGKRPLMGEIAARLADQVIITSDNPRSESPDEIIRQIVEGVSPGAAVDTVADRREAIRKAVTLADPGTVVVIAGKGHENYQVIGDQIVHFDDREEVEAALEIRRTTRSTETASRS